LASARRDRFGLVGLDSGNSVRHNYGVEIRHLRSATRHRISRVRSRYVIDNAAHRFAQPAPSESPYRDDRLVFLGPDQDGVLLEVMAICDGDRLLVIHAQLLRDRYRSFFD
jgi:hypothetical protein